MTRTSQAKQSAFLELSRWLAAITALGILVWIPRTPVLFFALCAGTPLEFYEADLNHDDYVSVADAATLQELPRLDGAALLSMAVRFGSTRLIDNELLP